MGRGMAWFSFARRPRSARIWACRKRGVQREVGSGLWVVEEVVDELAYGLVGFGGSGGVDVECHGWAMTNFACGRNAPMGTSPSCRLTTG